MSTSKFAALMQEYDRVDSQLAAMKEAVEGMEAERDNLRTLLRDEVLSLGVAKGSKLEIEDVGTFHFTSRKHYRIPAEYREQFVRELIQSEQQVMLSIGKADLKVWCEDMERTDTPLPTYLAYHEDKFVPVISLDSAKERRAEKARTRARSQGT